MLAGDGGKRTDAFATLAVTTETRGDVARPQATRGDALAQRKLCGIGAHVRHAGTLSAVVVGHRLQFRVTQRLRHRRHDGGVACAVLVVTQLLAQVGRIQATDAREIGTSVAGAIQTMAGMQAVAPAGVPCMTMARPASSAAWAAGAAQTASASPSFLRDMWLAPVIGGLNRGLPGCTTGLERQGLRKCV